MIIRLRQSGSTNDSGGPHATEQHHNRVIRLLHFPNRVWGGISVLGWICHNRRTHLNIVNVYMNDLRCMQYMNDIRQHGFYHVFQQDNARCHVAWTCMDYLGQNHFLVLPWPASTSLSPIEHLWAGVFAKAKSTWNATKLAFGTPIEVEYYLPIKRCDFGWFCFCWYEAVERLPYLL